MLLWELGEYLSYPRLFYQLYRANNRPHPNIKEEKIPYGPASEQYIITFYPTDSQLKDQAIYFIHGGGWRIGSPSMFKFIGYFFAQLGYPTVSIGYRLAPDSQYPVQIEDTFQGFLKGQKLLSDHGFTPDSSIIVGNSAGGYLGSYLVYDRERQSYYGIDQDDFAGLISISGPVDLGQCHNYTIRSMLKDFLGDLSMRETANPINLLTDKEDIPTLCIHGEKDPIVEKESSISFIDKLNDIREGLGLYI